MILNILKSKIKEYGRELTLREIASCKELPALVTIYRIFKTTSMKDVYKKIK